jgi:peptidoglycan/xylan/chitin deacetylase (PgdA/CDA1 family)
MNRVDSIVLTYHSIDTSGSVVSVSPGLFQAHMLALKQSGTPVVPLSLITSTPGAVAITFDDGFRNFKQHALPILAEHHFPSTVFTVSRYSGQFNSWPQPVGNIPTLALMTSSELAEIAQLGVEIGAHTANHVKLTAIPPAEAEREMLCGKEMIENATGHPVTSFAYPYGACSTVVREIARRHFRLACGVRLAPVRAGCDLFEMPRVDVYYVRDVFWFSRLQSAAGAAYLSFRRIARELRSRCLDRN